MKGKRAVTALATAALGVGAAIGVAACGDEERGTVEIEGGTTGTGTGAPSTVPTGGDATSTAPTLPDPATVDEAPTTPTTE